MSGKPDASELIRRINSADADELMPPKSEDKPLSAAQMETLRKWIEQGAEFQQHWAFRAVQRPALPQIRNPKSEIRNSIDHFILARLETEGLKPSPEADRETLIRRVTLDLTGLPPTLAEIDAFVNDRDPKAYDKVVDRLLDSPHYGERIALEWLDAARFADTNGYHIDNGRDMSRWRMWVIDSFNRNLPFDQFTIQQLAGDLLPAPADPAAARALKLASGFNRNHMINFEGGAIPQEYLNAYIVDRVNTTSTVWLGLTLACTQCHDHKSDPFTQKEFYQLYAFFNNVPENGLDGRTGNAPPMLKVPTASEESKLTELAAKIVAIEQRLTAANAELDAAQAEWERSATKQAGVEWTVLPNATVEAVERVVWKKLEDGSFLASGKNGNEETYTVTLTAQSKPISAIRLETLPHESFTSNGPGRSVNGNFVMTEVKASLLKLEGNAEPLKIKKATADFSQDDYPIAHVLDGKPNTGWAIYPKVGAAHFAVLEFATPIVLGEGERMKMVFEFHSRFGQHVPGRIRISTTDSPTPHDGQLLPENVLKTLAVAADQRSDAQKSELRKFFREQISVASRSWSNELAKLKAERNDYDKLIPTVMVMQELEKPRDTFVLMRGQYDKPSDKVAAGTPAALPALPEGAPSNRLGLAQWLVHPSHPLTSRVIVNRFWQMYFGTGLVKTSEDFGSQGEQPSHPELLDWLAAEFMGIADSSALNSQSAIRNPRSSYWDVKHLQRLIVTSATYRQASQVTLALVARDPENRLLARGPRQRLPAELIRDLALSVSGLMKHNIGGPSVSPYQPPGLWEELMSRADGKNWTAQEYTQSHGDDLYRRTMYTFWKRTCPPPTLATFDAPDRETCTVRRARTNTPLQALILMNDPTYLEASRKLAERILQEGGATFESRTIFAFRLAVARKPSERELSVFRRVFDQQVARFRTDTVAATKFLSAGESPRNEQLPQSELAAWTMIASMILNLDETVTKG